MCNNIKCAKIRGEGGKKCPFGLPIVDACENAGNSVDRMAPIDNLDGEDIKNISKANRLVYAYHKECRKCKYADKVLEKYKKVDCDFGDTAEGQRTPAFRGSPLYPQTFTGVGLDGLYGYPLGFYADNNESRNLFFGLFSFLGHATIKEMIKLADKYDRCNEIDKGDILDNLLKKLNKIRGNNSKIFDKIERYLNEYRENYENNRSDTGLLWELAQKWWGPRQVSR